jgi:hypothetical protein
MWAAVDDVKPPTIVEEAVAALERNPAAVMAHGPILVTFPGHRTPIEIAHDIDLLEPHTADRVRTFTREFRHNAMVFGLFRRSALSRAAPYRQHVGHDYLMCLQMCLLGPIERVASPLVVYYQRWGSVDTPMYTREPITLRDLLVYRGVRRRKCWVTLLLGCYYVARARGVGPGDRLRAAAAHVGTFGSRYRRELLDEIPFLLCTPLLWLFSPFVPSVRRVKRTLARRGLLGT